MEVGFRTHLVTRISQLASEANIGSTQLTPRMRVYVDDDDQLVGFVDEFADQFEEATSALAREPTISQKFSEKFVESKLLQMVLDAAVHGNGVIESHLDRLFAEAKSFNEEHSVRVPISGLIMDGISLKVGNIFIRKTDESEKAQFKARLTEFHQNWPEEHRKQVTLEKIDEFTVRAFSHSTYAEYVVEAEPTRAIERALEESRRACEVLTLACAARFPNSQQGNTVICVDGEGLSTGPLITVGSSSGYNMSQSSHPSSMPVTLSEGSREELVRLGIYDFFAMLAKPRSRVTDLENALLRAVHWFSSGQSQVEPENQLLNLITSIEALVCPKDRSPVSSSIAESAAIILGRTYHDRQELRAFLLRMYGYRSGISHGGAKVASELEVRQLRRVACRLILKVSQVHGDLASRSQLLDLVDRVKLGAGK